MSGISPPGGGGFGPPSDGPFAPPAVEVDIKVDPIGNLRVDAREQLTFEGPNSILEASSFGRFSEESRLLSDDPIQVIGPGIQVIDKTDF
jgi:hypothetical protein